MRQRWHAEQSAGSRRSAWVEPDDFNDLPPESPAQPRRSKHAAVAATAAPRPQTPAPPFSDPPTGATTALGGGAAAEESPARRRPRLRSFIVGSSALASVAVLVAVAVFPATTAALADSPTFATPQQAFVAGDTTDTSPLLDEILISPVTITTPEIGLSGGVLSVSGLADTKLQYRFAQEVTFTDGFGYRSASVAGFQDAQDVAAGGTPIRIVGDGVITEAGWASSGCGFSLQVQHEVAGENVFSRYCHMQENSHSWQVGQTVRGGDQAGLVGTTGVSFGNHPHLVMRVEDEPVDPLPFIAANSR